MTQSIFQAIKAIPRFRNFLKKARTVTVSRFLRDNRHYRYVFQRLLQQTAALVRQKEMTGGILTNRGEFFLKLPGDVYLFYNVENNGFPLGDGQGLDFQAAIERENGYDVVSPLLGTDDWYFDVGANNGYYYSLRVAKNSPARRVFAFEPNPKILPHLKRNVAFNQIDNIQIVPIALSDRNGRSGFAHDLGASSYLLEEGASGSHGIDVEVDTLDNYVQRNEIGRVDFLKADIEGGEANLLRGAEGVIKRFQPIMVLELREHLLSKQGSSLAEVFRFLGDRKYYVFRITNSSDFLCLPDSKLNSVTKLPAGLIEKATDG